MNARIVILANQHIYHHHQLFSKTWHSIATKSKWFIDQNTSHPYFIPQQNKHSLTSLEKICSPIRTHLCGELGTVFPLQENDSIDSTKKVVVSLCGWLQSSRGIGGLLFGVLRDWSGIVQFVWSRDIAQEQGYIETFDKAVRLSLESVIHIQGEIRLRPSNMINSSQNSGHLEIAVMKFHVLNIHPDERPIEMLSTSDEHILESNDDTKLRWRFLEMRKHSMSQNPSLQDILRLRSNISMYLRNFLHQQGFVEVETPLLFKSTPEGANEFLVPSRIGGVYALPQSPQQCKQMLMAGGLDKYFQIARCFRDEDLRSNRQPEFTQLDMEMSFIKQDDILNVTEKMISKTVMNCLGVNAKFVNPFPRLKYFSAMEKYGSDKPDTRYALHLKDVTMILRECFHPPPMFADVLDLDGCVKAINCNQFRPFFSRKEAQLLQKHAQIHHAKGILVLKVNESGSWNLPQSAHSLLDSPVRLRLSELLNIKANDVVLFYGNKKWKKTCNVLGHLRSYCAKKMEEKGVLVIPKQFNFLWITEFPLFDIEKEEKKKHICSMHHPFTAPHNDDIVRLEQIISTNKKSLIIQKENLNTLASIRAQAYDLVCNGVELGGGSIRIHTEALQKDIFHLLNTPDSHFAHLLKALRHGMPPHGGIAIGLDRLVSLLSSPKGYSLPLHHVIAFPKSASGRDLLFDSPSILETTIESIKNVPMSHISGDSNLNTSSLKTPRTEAC